MSDSTPSKTASAPLKVFCSYSHKDEGALDAFRSHLSALRLSGLIEDWHDRKIPPGGDWDKEIRENLDAADLILLLISSDFIDSEYCMQKETARALSRHKARLATVIPVFLRQCVVRGLPFDDLQGAPRDRKWVDQQPSTDKAWTEVTEAVRSAALIRLGVKTWPINPDLPDPWKIPVHPTGVGQQEASASTDSTATQTQPAVLNAGAPVHADIANGEPGKGSIILAHKGLWASLAAFVLLVAGWFVWDQYLNRENNVFLQVAKRYLDQGEYQKAQNSCQKAPASAFRKTCLTVTGLALNDVDDRNVYLEQLKDNGSAYTEVLLGEFRVADFDGENNTETLDLAKKRFDKALQMDKGLASAYFGKGQIEHLSGKPNAAVPLYQQALSLAPESERYQLNLATALADSGDYAKAENLLHKLLATHAEVLLAHAELIEALTRQNKWPEAKKAAKHLQALLTGRGSDVICQPVNLAEWFVLQDGVPAFISSWAYRGVDSLLEKQIYLNHASSSAKGPLIQLPDVDCGVVTR